MTGFDNYSYREVFSIYFHEDFPLNIDSIQLADLLKKEDDEREEAFKEILDENHVDYFDDELESVEHYASQNGLVSSEEELSQRFKDSMIQSHAIGFLRELKDDETALNTYFTEYSDLLTKSGELHPLQYASYEWKGSFDDI